MSIPAQSGPTWSITPLSGGNWLASITFTGASQVSDAIEVYDRPIDTVHIFGTFNGQTVTLKGFNANVSAASPQALHQGHSSASTFSTVGSELMASMIETPRYLIAQSDGAVTSVTVAIVLVDRKGK